jgi:predicted ester cyclase
MTSGSADGFQAQTNTATVAHMFERLNAGDVEGFVDALAPGYVRHCQAMPPGMEEIRGPEAMRRWLLGNQVTFPDYHELVEQLVGDGDFVAWRSAGSGTQSGPLGPFPPTGRRMSIVVIGMHRFEQGKVAETWTSWDSLAAMRQLGLLPA